MIQSWFTPDFAKAINSPAWSLSVEMFFYALFPALMRLAGRRRTALLLSGSYALTLLPLLSHTGPLSWPLNNIGSFALGLTAALWFREARSGPALRFFSRLPVFYLFAGATVALFCLRAHVPGMLFRQPILAPLFALVVTSAACCSGRFRILESKPLTLLGDASYSLYILHVPLWSLYAYVLGKLSLTFDALAPIIVFVAGMIAVSAVSYVYFEVPARRAILRLLGKRPATHPARAAAAVP